MDFGKILEESGLSGNVANAASSAYSALFESATSILYHFLTPTKLAHILNYNKFTTSPNEQNIIGEGNRYISFSRTGSFREGFPILLQTTGGLCDDSLHDSWGIARLTIDGDRLNRFANVSVGHGRGKPKTKHSMRVRPFDWAHEFYKGGSMGDLVWNDGEHEPENGKEWMLQSNDIYSADLPVDTMHDVWSEHEDRYAHPYSQAEDRLITTAEEIPNASKLILKIDIILSLENFSKDNREARKYLYDSIARCNMKNKIRIFPSVHDFEAYRRINFSNNTPWFSPKRLKPEVLLATSVHDAETNYLCEATDLPRNPLMEGHFDDPKMEKAIDTACKIAGVDDEGDLSDGNHTFNDLYHQRCILFATLVNIFPEISWKTKRHDDGELCFGGKNFLVCIDTPAGPYSYHYPLEDWDRFNCQEIEKAKPFDGHTDKDVERLLSLVDLKPASRN